MSQERQQRNVKRVLVMLDYGPEDPDSGEVIDVTALLTETANAANFYPSISLQVSGYFSDYAEPKLKMDISWWGSSSVGCSGRSGWLADVLNYSLPDNDRVDAMRKRAKRMSQHALKLFGAAVEAKMDQVAAVRALHPIAKMTRTALEDLHE